MNMRLSLWLCTVFLILGVSTTLYSQEGQHYVGSKEMLEKHYEVSQKHGKNNLKLATIKRGYYDEEGNLVDQIIQQGNKTYLGRIRKHISKDPYTVETLEYDHMQQLVSRKVEIAGAKEGELTTLEYDTKGKLVNKSSIRIYQDQLWTLDYSQVGYVANYIQSIGDEANRISEQRVFDHADELKEIHSHLYDRDNRLLAVVAQNPEDSVLFRIEYKYDYLGNIIEEKHFEGEDTLVSSIRISYDDSNRILQRAEYIWNPRFGTIPQLRKQSEYSYK
ncbi:MAG: hypothetical protein PHO16_08580 [Candidatus Cloacimonetes bacterium]|nr:hypothetical protein [Candidatus Cloacimonadota bacterium]